MNKHPISGNKFAEKPEEERASASIQQRVTTERKERWKAQAKSEG
jgi:hypothetical protein